MADNDNRDIDIKFPLHHKLHKEHLPSHRNTEVRPSKNTVTSSIPEEYFPMRIPVRKFHALADKYVLFFCAYCQRLPQYKCLRR